MEFLQIHTDVIEKVLIPVLQDFCSDVLNAINTDLSVKEYTSEEKMLQAELNFQDQTVTMGPILESLLKSKSMGSLPEQGLDSHLDPQRLLLIISPPYDTAGLSALLCCEICRPGAFRFLLPVKGFCCPAKYILLNDTEFQKRNKDNPLT